MMRRNIPLLTARGKNIPGTWEESVIKLNDNGIRIATEYDREGDPPSWDCTMVMVIANPLVEPRLHRSFPANLQELENYRQEIVDGIHDYYVKEKSWSYSYHNRVYNYLSEVDQIEYVVNKLGEAPYSRRAQAITWIPRIDTEDDEPPCLQRLWFRLVKAEGALFLNLNMHWRSRDALKAAFMNLWALSFIYEEVVERLDEKFDKKVKPGRLVDISDSYHVYGKDEGDLENFVHRYETDDFENRVWRTEEVEDILARGGE